MVTSDIFMHMHIPAGAPRLKTNPNDDKGSVTQSLVMVVEEMFKIDCIEYNVQSIIKTSVISIVRLCVTEARSNFTYIHS